MVGKFVVKSRGHNDVGLFGVVIKSHVNSGNHHILEVLSEGKVVNWLADLVDVMEKNHEFFNEKNEKKKSKKGEEDFESCI